MTGELSPAATAELLKALGDETRLRLLTLLRESSSENRPGVCELSRTLAIPQPTLSHHLKVLKSAGVILCRKESTFCYYEVNEELIEESLGALISRGDEWL